jgi:antitoxin ParD1/3/4
MNAKAAHLRTADKKHFGKLSGQTIGGVIITTPGEYLRGRRGDCPHGESAGPGVHQRGCSNISQDAIVGHRRARERYAMNISLPQQLEAWVDERVKTGMYQSASEVVREALRLLREQEDLKQLRTQELRRQLQVGVEQLDRGASRPFDEGVVAEVKNAGRKRRRDR